MSSRTPIQVPEDLKNTIEGLKDEFGAKTNYEVIERLVTSYEAFLRFKDDMANERAAERQRKTKEMLQVGEAAKKDFDRLKAELSISNDEGLLAFLLIHYEQSNSFDKVTLRYLRGLK